MKLPFFGKGKKEEHSHDHDHHPGHDAKQSFDSCTGEPNVERTPAKPRAWAPNEFGVKIMVAGDLNRSRDMSRAVMKVQQELAEQFKKDYPDTKLVMCVDTFLDGCRHTTGWTDRPSDIGGTTTRWHCYQTETRFNEAFESMATSTDKDADVVLIVGNRFDDNLDETVKAAKKLMGQKKTRVFALPDANAPKNVQESYKQISHQAGGVSMPLDFTRGDAEKEYATVVREVTQHTIKKATGQTTDLTALPAPDETTRRLRLELKKL